MSIQLSFTEEIVYEETPAGITIFISLRHGESEMYVEAKVDTGAEVCLFTNEIGRRLGIPIEQGVPITIGTLAGALEAFGHEITLQTGELTFQSVVYFAKYPGLPRNILGRRGWLRNLKMAVVDYDNLLYLSAYES